MHSYPPKNVISAQPATARQRFAAFLINWVAGGLPILIPAMLSKGGDPNSWTGNELILDWLRIGLGTVQILFVHRMQGSPGTVFAGLRVQHLDGSRPSIAATLIRAIPYLAILVLFILKPNHSGKGEFSAYPLLFLTIYAFIFVSAVVMLVTGSHSLMDRLSGTVVMKAYKVGDL